MAVGSCVSEAESLAAWLALGPTRAYGRTRWLLAGSFERSMQTQLAEEARLLAESGGEDDAAEGIAAFLQRRAPNFGTSAS